MNILIVDDELVSRAKMQKILGFFGKCVAVDNGAKAVKAYTAAWETGKPFGLITLDLVMPDLDGMGVLSKIRDIEEKLGVIKEERAVIMMVTSQSDQANVIRCLKAGSDDYIVKPFTIDLIRQKLVKYGIQQITLNSPV